MLFKAAGCQAESFNSAEEFLESETYCGEGCIILDIFLEGRSGLELQEQISKKFPCLPIIFITGQGDIPMSVQAIKEGAVNFLQKPVDDTLLLKVVEDAMNLSHNLFEKNKEEKQIRDRIDKLTPREYEIFRLIITGMLNKQIAAELNIAEHTVKLPRGKITKKLAVKSIAEMVTLANKLNI
jgi:FixJ family two-component response regulator